MRQNEEKKAVIYCRVSSVKQTTKGDGLASQETRCREYASYKGYEVVNVFQDDMSGSLISRPGMQAMLKFLRNRRSHQHIVIIDDISRLARGLDAHLELRGAIARAGAILESPSIEFGEDSDSKLVENLLASVSQHQRQKISETTVNRMRARVMNGYWPFRAPVGLKHVLSKGQGRVLVRDEPLASIVAEALEGYASGRFQLQAEVKRFLESHPEFPKNRKGEVRAQLVADMLGYVLYAGYVEAPDWNVSLRQGQHEGLISWETRERIQARMNGQAKAPARANLNEDIPLRGFVTCGDCGTPLTACWSRGRNARYPYYLCPKRGCESYGKSIKRDVLEGEFDTLVGSLMPREGLFNAAFAMFRTLWDHRLAHGETRKNSLRVELGKIEGKVDQFLDRIADTEDTRLVRKYEDRIRRLEEQRILLSENIAKSGRSVRSFDETLRTAFDFLKNPQKLWRSERLEEKRAVLKLAFGERLAYVRNEGFRTAETALPFKALAGFCGGENVMASPRGIEPLFPA